MSYFSQSAHQSLKIKCRYLTSLGMPQAELMWRHNPLQKLLFYSHIHFFVIMNEYFQPVHNTIGYIKVYRKTEDILSFYICFCNITKCTYMASTLVCILEIQVYARHLYWVLTVDMTVT